MPLTFAKHFASVSLHACSLTQNIVISDLMFAHFGERIWLVYITIPFPRRLGTFVLLIHATDSGLLGI